MADSVCGTRQGTAGPSSSLSGSKAIRRRVDLLLRSSSMDPSIPASQSRRSPSPHSSRNNGHTHSRELSTTSSSSRGSKRPKHADRPENRISDAFHVATSTSLHSSLDSDYSHHSHKKGKSIVNKHPFHHQHDFRLSGLQDEKRTNGEYSGAIAVSEFERMKKEIESLREGLYEAKRSFKRQTKKLEELKSELSTATHTIQDKNSEVSRLRIIHDKNEGLISAIEASIQCQICMDLPHRPFSLSPCGHVLCLPCLQEWFRKAPPTQEDLDSDFFESADPQYILLRSKTCPSCRALVKHRPAPVFMIKSVAQLLQKAKPGSTPPIQFRSDDTRITEDNDPWKGIFPSSDEDSEYEDDQDADSFLSESDSEDDIQLRAAPSHWYRRQTFGINHNRSRLADTSDSDEDHAENVSDSDDGSQPSVVYVRSRWAPPIVTVQPGLYDLSEEGDPDIALKLLQRGCTWDMLQNYELSYRHDTGIVLYLRSLNRLYASGDDSDTEGDAEAMNRVFLGWNIAVDEHDSDGERFISDILEDIKARPQMWQTSPRPGVVGAFDVRRLVRVEDAERYATTDSEAWVDADDFE